MALFPDRGYDGTSVEAIAQAAGVSKLTVYSHFADKETLFGAAVTECCAQMLPHRLFVPAAGAPVTDLVGEAPRQLDPPAALRAQGFARFAVRRAHGGGIEGRSSVA